MPLLLPSAESWRSRAARISCALVAVTLVAGCFGKEAPAPQNPADVQTGNVVVSTQTSNQNQNISESADSNKLTRYAGWIVVAVGAQASIFALATSYLMLHESAERSSDCNAQKVCTADGVDANSKLGQTGAFNAASWAVTAAGLGVGAYLVLTNPPRDDGASKASAAKSSPSAAVGVGPSGSGVGLNFRSQF